MPAQITPDNAVSFFQGVPRRIDEAAGVISESEAAEGADAGQVDDAVIEIVDSLNRLIHQIQSANYGPDDDIAEAFSPTNLRSGSAGLLETACTEVARGIGGIGQWEASETRELLGTIDQAVNAISGRIRELQALADEVSNR